MKSEIVLRLRISIAVVEPQLDELKDQFHRLLLDRCPHLKEKFNLDNTTKKHLVLAEAMCILVDYLDRRLSLDAILANLGAIHGKHNITDEEFFAARDAFIEAISIVSGDRWSDNTRKAWMYAFNMIIKLMKKNMPAQEAGVVQKLPALHNH